MSDIQFESDNMNFVRKGSATQPGGNATGKGMSGWLIAHGLARSENVAQYILVGFIAFNFFLNM
jgi:hypothetical protein